MSINSTFQWEVRTTGSDSNGGGFDANAAGTDFSQQDAAQVAYTDLVISGSTVTSAAHPFSSVHAGNILNITGGTGFTTGRYVVGSVSGSTATLDRSPGTNGSTGGTGNLGGALLTIATAVTNAVDNNEIHIKAGTYTHTANISISKHLAFYGYASTRLDGGTKPLITTATNSTILFTTSGASQKSISCSNLSFSNTATTRALCWSPAGSGRFAFANCVFDGFTSALSATSGPDALFFYACEIKNCTANAIGTYLGDGGKNLEIVDCYIHDNVDGITYPNGGNSSSGGLAVIRSLIVHNSGKGINYNAGQGCRMFLLENTIANNTGDGVTATSLSQQQVIIASNIFYGNGGVGLNFTWNAGGGFNGNKYDVLINRNNAFGANTGGNVGSGITTGLNAVTLTADPFTASGSGDYSLNSTSGGGTACKQAGFQWGA